MSPEQVAKTWVWKGLADLYLAFHINGHAFWPHSKFHEIMGLEKFLKALLLHSNGTNYQLMPEQSARIEVNKLATKLGHKFGQLIDNADKIIGEEKITRLKQREFSGFSYEHIVAAMESGYLEYRYPVPRPEYLNHQIGKEKRWRDPLGSSGVTDLVYQLCRLCYLELQKDVDFGDILEIYENRYAELESFSRFKNLFWQHGMVYQFG